MKLFKVIVLVLCAGFLNVGCASTESPERLIEKPRYNEKEQRLYGDINASLDAYSTIILPKNSSEVATINEVDLDNNKVDEIVVFQKKENLNEGTSKVGFSVLKNGNQSVYTSGEYLVNGESIEYANFYDLNNDGLKEILLVTKNGTKSNLDICQFKDGKITRLYRFDPSWIEDKDGFSEMKVNVGNLDNKGNLDIIISSYNPETHELAVSLTYFDEYIKLKDFTILKDVKNLDSAYINIDKVSKDKKGIVVDTRSFTDNDSYITQILYLDKNRLYKAFDENNMEIKKPYYIPVEDMNNDGVVELPVINSSTKGYNPKTSAIISWYVWNGKTKEESKPVFVSQVYYNYENNFKLNIPNNLANKIYVEVDHKNKNSFEFVYYDIHQTEPVKLFTINKVPKNKIDENKRSNHTTNTNISGTLILENDKESYILMVNNPKIFKSLNLSEDAIQENFKAIY